MLQLDFVRPLDSPWPSAEVEEEVASEGVSERHGESGDERFGKGESEEDGAGEGDGDGE